jgi:hypothetical protein
MGVDKRRPPRRKHRRECVASHRHERQAWGALQTFDQGLTLSRNQHLVQSLPAKVAYQQLRLTFATTKTTRKIDVAQGHGISST